MNIENKNNIINQPDLTVVICAYNAADFIEETLFGFKNQTFKAFKLLVIDDCSTDMTSEFTKSFITRFRQSYWSVIKLPANVGLANSRKFSENLVDTEFVLDFDADDIPLPDMLEKLINILRIDPLCMGVGCYCDYINSEGNKIGTGFYVGPLSKKQFHIQASQNKLIFLHHPMYRRQFAKDVGGRAVNGFPQGQIRYQDMCEDLDLWVRMSDFYQQGNYFVVLPEPLFLYRKHTNAMSNNSAAMNERIRHIKYNLIRRRNGLPELSFLDYLNSRSNYQIYYNKWIDKSAYLYKQAGRAFVERNYIRLFFYMSCCFLLSPKFLIKKTISNIKLNSF